jgi:excisionase family DNA binding protein
MARDFTTRQAARRFGVSESAIYKYRRAGLLPARRRHGKLLFDREAVERYAAEGQPPAARPAPPDQPAA